MVMRLVIAIYMFSILIYSCGEKQIEGPIQLPSTSVLSIDRTGVS